MGRRRKKHRRNIIISAAALITAAAVCAIVILWRTGQVKTPSPEELLRQYAAFLSEGKYEELYSMLDSSSQSQISREDFVTRNKNIYEGIEAKEILLSIDEVGEEKDGAVRVSYHMSMDSVAGKIEFSGSTDFYRDESKNFRIFWKDSLIFPELGREDKVRVSTDKANRAQVLDRDQRMLAGVGTASLVGLVPEKMSGNLDEDLGKMADLLGITKDSIEKKLSAKWVKEDSFVPVKTIKKPEADSFDLSGNFSSDRVLQDELLTIPGVLITDTKVRSYPLGEKASHLVGYVQNVTAEDLKEHEGEGYLSDSVIGRSGMETLYEQELRGRNGVSVSIVSPDGEVKKVLASVPKTDGTDIQLTIDSRLQEAIHDAFQEDKSCTVAMNPHTGEALALVSTPSYDNNDFIFGMPQEKWDQLNGDENMPLYNRFRQTFPPGSSMKPITAVIGLETGDIEPEKDYGNEGLRWQKDSGWGNYFVTTLHEYSPATLENALIYSDNIYFAKTALRMGDAAFQKGLDSLGFRQTLPFEISVSQSRYSNEEVIGDEIQLADSGYGQGQVLMNPIHLASIYTLFLNEGTILKPVLRLNGESGKVKPEAWIPNAVSAETADRVEKALIQAVHSDNGTGRAARRSDMVLAGKTGTAEIKAYQGDTTGTELGWFAVFTTDPGTDQPLLIVTMVEDVKDRGGSGYVVKKVKEVMDRYFLTSS